MTNNEDSSDLSIFDLPEYSVMIANLTSSALSIESQDIELIEMREDKSLILSIPKSSCNVHHHLSIEIICAPPKSAGDKITFSATAKVTQLEEVEEGICRATLVLLQYSETEWVRLLSRQEDRQNELQKFFDSARG